MYHQLETTTSCDDMANTIHSMEEEYETGIFLQLRDHLPNHQRDHLVDHLASSTTPNTPTTSQTTTPTATTTVATTPTTTTTTTTVTTTPTSTVVKAGVACTSSPDLLRLKDHRGHRSTHRHRADCRDPGVPRPGRSCAGDRVRFGASFVDTAECTGAATVLNEMADAYVGGGSQACEATTPTTTVTTSVTTTPIVAAFECVANYGTISPGGTSCSDDVPKLNANLLATCATVAGTLTCKMLNGVKNLADQASTTSCDVRCDGGMIT